MAAKEIYDYVSTVVPDYDSTLDIAHQDFTIEMGSKNEVVHTADDSTDRIVDLSDESIFFVKFPYKYLSEANSGTIFDLYHDEDKANGKGKSFKWDHPQDGHTYVVRFDMDLERERKLNTNFGLGQVVLKIVGRIAD